MQCGRLIVIEFLVIPAGIAVILSVVFAWFHESDGLGPADRLALSIMEGPVILFLAFGGWYGILFLLHWVGFLSADGGW